MLAEISDALPDVDLRSSNAVGLLESHSSKAFALDTEPGRIHVAMSLDLPENVQIFESGSPTALQFSAPGAPFAWLRVTPAFHGSAARELPSPVRTIADSLTREWAITVLPDGAVAVLGGVNDPYPASALVAMASLAPEELAAELPPKAWVEVVELEAHEASFRALHVRYDEGPLREAADRFNLAPEAWGFSAGHHAGIVVGGSARAVSKVVDGQRGHTTWAAYPPQLIRDLEAGSCSAALFLPLDPLQSALDRELALALLEARGVLSPTLADEIRARAEGFRALSSIAIWLTQPEAATVVHAALETFGNTVTEEGKDALRTLAEIDGGAPPGAAYEALAAKYPDSERYRQRIGETLIGRALALGAGLSVPRTPRKPARRSKASTGRTVGGAELRGHGIYTPDPDSRKIAAVRVPANAGSIRVAYCVARTGKVTNVRVTRRRGQRNPKIDAIVVDTVKRWRFKPVIEDGKPVERCASADFGI